MAYIDSELAKRRLNAISLTGGNEDDTNRAPGPDSGSSGTAKTSKSLEKQPATLGKLLEIDLGNEARDRNVVRTEQARRRLGGEDVEDESATEGKKSKKPKLGRDGKPWRERKRRTSEDIRRDKLVEEVLRENRRKSTMSCPTLGPDCILTTTQSICTKSSLHPLSPPLGTAKPMTRSRKLSGASSWMRCHSDSARKLCRRLQLEGQEGRRKRR